MMDRRQVFGLAAGGAGLIGASRVFADVPAPGPDATAALDALRADKESAGGVLVAVRGGRAVSVYHWGQASLPFSVPVSERTLFHLGSNGKFMTSVAVAQLVEAGAVAFDDPIGKHVANLPPAMADIALSHLLHHTSGIPDYTGFLADWDRPQTREVVLEAMKDKPLQFQPGESWTYSNSNYLLLGWLIESVTGQKYADYVRRRLFEAGNLPTARADAAQRIVPLRAEPYEFENGTPRHAVRMEDGVSRAADGGLLFSALDAAPWRVALDSDRLVSAATMQRLLAPGRLNTGRAAPYGCGVFLEQTRGAPVRRHTGGVPGFVSNWITWPASDLSILAMTNSDSRKGPSLTDMIVAFAESIQPGVSWAGLDPVGDGSDNRTRLLRALLERPEGAPAPDGLLAPEMAWRPDSSLGRVSGLTSLAPLERWAAGDDPGQGEMERYRFTTADGARQFVVGWTADDRIYWM